MTLRRKIITRSVLFVLLILLGAALFRASGILPEATKEGLLQFQQRLRESGWMAPAVYTLLCAVAVVLFIPAIPLILAGALFGAVLGSVCAFAGLLLGASASFLLSRYAFRPLVERLIMHRPVFQRLDEGVKREGWHMVLVTRLLPIFPFCPQNYAYGVTGISFRAFTLVSGVCILPAVVAYVLIGASLISGKGNPGETLGYLLGGATVLGLLYLAMRLVRRKYRLPHTGDNATPGEPLAKEK